MPRASISRRSFVDKMKAKARPDLTVADLARAVGCSTSYAYTAVHHHNLPFKAVGGEAEAAVLAAYEPGLSILQLCARTKVNEGTLRAVLRRNGLEYRRRDLRRPWKPTAVQQQERAG